MRVQANDPWFESMVTEWNLPRSKKEQEQWYSQYNISSDAIRVVIDTDEQKSVGLTGLLNVDWKKWCCMICRE